MTMQHNRTLPHCSNPLQILRHSQNLVTASNSLLRHSHDLPLFNSNHYFNHDSTTHTPTTAAITPLDLDRLHFFVHRLNGWTCVFRLLSNLPSSNPGAICMHSGWYSSLFPSATLLRRSLSGHHSASKPVVAGALRTQHNPHPSAFTVRLSHGLGMQLCVGQQAANNLSFGSVQRTGAIVAKRWSVRFTCSTSKGPGVRHAIHRQE